MRKAARRQGISFFENIWLSPRDVMGKRENTWERTELPFNKPQAWDMPCTTHVLPTPALDPSWLLVVFRMSLTAQEEHLPSLPLKLAGPYWVSTFCIWKFYMLRRLNFSSLPAHPLPGSTAPIALRWEVCNSRTQPLQPHLILPPPCLPVNMLSKNEVFRSLWY